MHVLMYLFWYAPRATKHRVMVDETENWGEDLLLEFMLCCGLIGRLSFKGNTAVLVVKSYHLILSDLVMSLLTLGLAWAQDPLIVLVAFCPTVFRGASEDICPLLHELELLSVNTRLNCLLCATVKPLNGKQESFMWNNTATKGSFAL